MIISYTINQYQFNDFYNLSLGLFNPQKHFADRSYFKSIIYKYNINKKISTIPIIFQVRNFINTKKIELIFKGIRVGHILVNDVYKIDEKDLLHLYGVNNTNKSSHPGFIYLKSLGDYAVGGKPVINTSTYNIFKDKYDLKSQFNKFFKKNNISDAVAFQTRNPPHKGHEFQIKKGLDHSKNLVINPIFGWKKKGDFNEKIVEKAYKIFIKKNTKNIFFKPITTNMRYLGPREAIHHAIIRQNLGFSHFIIGRDHAGVAGFYKKYESFRLMKLLNCENKLKIKILKFREPKYCLKCDKIFSRKNCSHSIKYFNGSFIRKRLSLKMRLPSYLIDQEVANLLYKNNKKYI